MSGVPAGSAHKREQRVLATRTLLQLIKASLQVLNQDQQWSTETLENQTFASLDAVAALSGHPLEVAEIAIEEGIIAPRG